MMPTWGTIGFQWGCNDCEAGSDGGFDGSRPTIKAEMERAARAHCLTRGHETHLDRMSSVLFDRVVTHSVKVK